MSQTTSGYESPALPQIAGYRLLRVIGHGGMATVYLGTQLSLGRDVAIKVMRPETLADEVSRRRFENETRTIARLEHPNIVGIHDVGRTADGLPWYAMPHLPHGHLGQRDLRGDQARVRAILQALLSALAYAHARGVIHRDVKAENVLFDETDRPLLADFGIALRRGYGTRMTMVGLAVGSTAYMAPEQARGQQVDFRADLYSVGVLAWEMLTGALPFAGEDALSMALAHVQNPVPRLPPELRHWQRFLDQALAKSPKRRFADAGQMLRALEQVPQRDGEARITGRIRRIGHDGRRLLPWLALPIVLLAGVGVWRAWERPSATTTAADEAAPTASIASAPPVADQDTADGDADADLAPQADPDAVAAAAGIEASQAAPVSEADRHLAAAERLLRAGKLAAPHDDNALERLRRARAADAQHLGLPSLTARVFAAVGSRATTLIAGRDDGAATDLLQAARAHAGSAEEIAALQPVRAQVADAIEARIADAVTAVDRDDAIASLAAADAAGLDAATKARLRREAQAIPDLNALAAKIPGGARVVRSGDTSFAIANAPVSRGDYAAFVAATGRKSAPCRARGSVLRALAPRDWESPGFDQSPNDPVVCVSWHDAVDYARWRSEREGRSIVVASTAQGAAAPASTDGPAEWRSDCAAACKDRIAAGRSRRDALDSRALDPKRGYDDVGFRLVHLP